MQSRFIAAFLFLSLAACSHDAAGKSVSALEATPVVGPLLQTSWGQGGVYQTNMPQLGGEPTYPGCTTVASAQVLYYYRVTGQAASPVSYGLDHGPLTGPDVVDGGHGLSVDVSAVSHDFDAMGLELESASRAEIDATTQFIYHVGATMNAQFGGGQGSSATGRQIENAFRYQWGYNQIARRAMTIISRTAFGFDDAEWAQEIRDELAAGRPVIYLAQEETRDIGHAFVIDGYATDGRVHVNWGWGGWANGWYDVATLEDPSGRRWIRDPMIFRGLEPSVGHASTMLPATPAPSTPEAHAWNGAFSLISHASGTATGYGLTTDEAVVSAGAAPVVFLQWEVDGRDGRRLVISADGASRATLTYGPWNDRSRDRRLENVALPFVLDPVRDGFSTADGEYYVVAVTFDESTSATVFAEPTDQAATPSVSVAGTPIAVDGYVWHGNGSLISRASGTLDGYGLTMDEARVHPSEDRPAVFFQWEIDGSDGRTLELRGDGLSEATLRYGVWNDRSRDVTRRVTLPYVLDPSADGLSTADGEYLVIMLGLDDAPTAATSVEAYIR